MQLSPGKIRVKPYPFLHAQTRGLWPSALLTDVLNEFPEPDDERLKHFTGTNEEKLEGGDFMFGPRTWELAQQVASIAPSLARIFDLPGDLEMELVGGGYHMIMPGGYLNIHSDFSVSPITRRYRRLNFLIYLNRGWLPSDGGVLELWDDEGPVTRVNPFYNNTAMFVTSAHSWHGHPVPVAEGKVRRSFAAYFYSSEPPLDFTDQSTVWHPRAPKIERV